MSIQIEEHDNQKPYKWYENLKDFFLNFCFSILFMNYIHDDYLYWIDEEDSLSQ